MNTRRTGNPISLRAIFSFLVILVLLAGAPAAGTAEAPEVHTHEGWTAVEALPTASGSYYLTKDIEISKTWTIGSGADISLCLNDHSITMTAAGVGITINGGTLNLYDCGMTAHSYTTDRQPATIGSGAGSFTGGYITHADGKTGPAIYMKSGQFSMFGGTLMGNNNTNDQYHSGAVDIAGGTFNLHNGTIAGNAGSNRLGGGGIYFTSGKMNIYGGEIMHNKGGFGGSGIMIYGGTVNMSDCSIHHNTGGAGGGVFIAGGTFYMSGGCIADNTATDVGGLVNNGILYMSGGNITGNTDSGKYGCVNNGGTMYLSGGSITGNTSNNGGIMNEGGIINISGNPVVAGNVNKAGNEVNVYLQNNKPMSIIGEMTSGARVGITTQSTPTAGTPVKFVLNYKTSNTVSPDNWFFSDKGLDVIVMNDTSDQDAYVAAKVTLTYDGNWADSGDVPAAQTVTHGTAVTIEGAGTLKKAGHFFSGWGREPGSRRSVESGNAASDDEGRGIYDSGDTIEMDGNITLYAQWDEGHTVTWQNGDGSLLDEKTWKNGDPEPETEKTPTKKPDEQYIYTFSVWGEPVTDDDGNLTFKPEFSTELQKYTVTFVNDDGSILKETVFEYGKIPAIQSAPEKPETAESIYTFAGWSDGTKTYAPGTELPVVKKNVTYKAVYTATARQTAEPTATPVITPAPTAAPAPTATPKPVPKTGDREDMILWTVLMTLCAGVVAVLLALKPDRKKK